MTDLTAQVRAIAHDALGALVDDLDDDTKFEDAGMDSLHVAELLFSLKEKFDIPFAGDELGPASSLADTVTLLLSRGVPAAQPS